MMTSKRNAPQSLGERIAQARRLLGVKEARDVMVPDLAKRVGVTAASLYNWEADGAVPGETNLGKLAAVLGVTPAWLRYGVQVSETPTLDRLQKDKEHTVKDVLESLQKPAAKRRNGGKAG